MSSIPKVVLEEAFTLPETAYQAENYNSPYGKQELAVDLLDIHERRLRRMDECGVTFMVLSLTSPGAQGESSPTKAQALATRANDYLAEAIVRNPMRFGGFASVSMHDPESAAKEATRAIKDLKLLGLILNDFQTTTDDGNTMKFFDQPEYDAFWNTIQDLDVPVYIHPRITTPNLTDLLLKERPWLWASAYFFSVGR